jgi:hypothetical protein
MNEGEKLKAIKLIKRIQYDGGRREDFEELERVTGDSTFWYVFDEMELSGLLPEEILDLFSGHYLSTTNNPRVSIANSQRVFGG